VTVCTAGSADAGCGYIAPNSNFRRNDDQTMVRGHDGRGVERAYAAAGMGNDETRHAHAVNPSCFMAPSGTTQHQFSDFQIHFVKQQFGSPGGAANFSRHLKFPFLLQELAHEFWREERGTGVLSEENRIERKITNTRASGRKSNAKMGAEGTPSRYLPRLFAHEGAEEFFAAAREVSTHREKFGTDCALCVPTAIVTVEAPNMDNTKTPEVLAVIPLPTAQERRRLEITLHGWCQPKCDKTPSTPCGNPK
jgi:hypothetical protein